MNDALAPAGSPLTLKVTVELNPLDGVAVTLYDAVLPAVTVWLGGVALTEKSPAEFTTRVSEVECVRVGLVPVAVSV